MLNFKSKQVPLSNLIERPIQTGFQVRDQGLQHLSFPQNLSFPRKRESSKEQNPPPHLSFPRRRESALTKGYRHYKLIQLKDAKPEGMLFQIKPEGLSSIVIPERKSKFMQKYLIQKDDVLYLSKLRPRAFRYTGVVESAIPMAHFYILRPKINIVDPDYLCWALNQSFIINSYIQKHLMGSALVFIPRSDLLKCPIPLPVLHTQKKITQLLKLRAKEQEIQSRIDEKKQSLINTAVWELL